MNSPVRPPADLRDTYRFLPPVVREAVVAYAGKAGLADQPADRIFEHFAAFHVLRSAGIDELDVPATVVAGENDTQLDAVAITINGLLVTADDEVTGFIRDAIDGEPFEVRFLFAQATMSSKFPSEKVALFSTGVQNFFLAESKLRQSPGLVIYRARKERIMQALAALGRGSAEADVFVVWPGTWTTDGHEAHATGIAEAGLDTLRAAGQLSAVRFHRIDSTRLQSLIIDETVANTGELALEGLAELPAIDGIGFACIGYVAAFDYLACLSNGDPASQDAKLKPDVFHGNVRAYLGDEARVNKHIKDSIVGAAGAEQSEFVLRNNGVTIIAEQAERIPGSNRLKLRNFQVVNGCQTSHVLFANRAHLKGDVRVPIKIIATRDIEIAQNIILGLNRQTQIDELQILARNDFVRRLKLHCDVAPVGRNMSAAGARSPLIMLERRTGEYREVAGVDRTRVVTLQELMQTYAAAFLDAPHSVHEGGKGYLLRQVPRRMFTNDHDVGFYYASALMLWRVRQALPSLHEWISHPAKHHLVFAMRTLADPPAGCPSGRRDGEAHQYLRTLRETLFNDRRASKFAERAVAIVVEAGHMYAAAHGGSAKLTSVMAQREAFCDQVLDLCLAERDKAQSPPPTPPKPKEPAQTGGHSRQ